MITCDRCGDECYDQSTFDLMDELDQIIIVIHCNKGECQPYARYGPNGVNSNLEQFTSKKVFKIARPPKFDFKDEKTYCRSR